MNSLPAKKKIGVEINPVALESARKYCDEAFASIEEVPSNSVDVVISNHALEHVPYPVRALTEIKRTLRPGGKLVLCVPIDDWRTQRKFDLYDINHHLNTWTPQLLGNSLTESGFSAESIQIGILVHAWFPNYLKYWKHRSYFDFLCRIYAWRVKRRQILAVAFKLD